MNGMKTRLLLFAAMLLAGCGDEAPKIPIEALNPAREETAQGKRIITAIEGEPETALRKERATSARFVKEAARFRDPDFLRKFIGNGYQEVAFGQYVVKEMLRFTGPTQDYDTPKWLPLDIKEIHDETLHMIQRSPPEARRRILKDLEIFLVFKTAYDAMDQDQRLTLVERLRRRSPDLEPPEPKGEAFFPLFWLRKFPIFWERGGRFWWWAGQALMQDGDFEIDEEGRVRFTPPGGTVCFHS